MEVISGTHVYTGKLREGWNEAKFHPAQVRILPKIQVFNRLIGEYTDINLSGHPQPFIESNDLYAGHDR